MKQKDLEELTDEELLKGKKKIQSNKVVNASLIGFCIGVVVYSAVKNGFEFFTFLPLGFVYLLSKNGKNIKALDQELKSRNLL
ncbi:hypothetical protein [Maribacter antarcticus]|uniref:hypothetical protein n=1 Tax=Maribacter antarcticus TaxID=505250 RepID=UPI00047E5C56|nr:hypothetical protein [Maribacter antarcticus]